MAKFDPSKIDWKPMKMADVQVGQKVLTIERERGTVVKIDGEDIHVRLRGDPDVTYYSAKELTLLP